MKKILALVACLSLAASLAIGGSIAYLTDRDSEANVFTVGNVKIDLKEEFDQGAPIVPGAQITKKPTISNTGASNAWVWMTVAIPEEFCGIEVPKDEQGKRTDAIFPMLLSKEISESGNWTLCYDDHLVPLETEINEKTYTLMTLLYKNQLKPDETTTAPFEKIGISNLVDIHPDGSMHFVQGGDVKPMNWNIKEDGNAIVYVSAYAIQTEGFDTIEEAYAAYNAQWGDKGTEYGKPAVLVTNENELAAVLTEADNVFTLTKSVITEDIPAFSEHGADDGYTFDGNGNTVTMKPTSIDSFQWIGGTIPMMSNIFSSANTGNPVKVTIKNLNIDGTMQSTMFGHYVNSSSNWYDTEATNVNIIGAKVVSFSAGVSPALTIYGKATLNNCNVYGTTLSELDTDPMWPAYDVAAVNYSDVTLNGGKYGSIYMWNQAKVTVDGADIDTIVIRGDMNTTKYGLTIKAGSTVNKIDMSNITNSSKVNITIENGANVKFIDGAQEYTTLTEWQNAQ